MVVCQVTGGTRQVTMADKPQLPYVDATIHETLRIAMAGEPDSLTHQLATIST